MCFRRPCFAVMAGLVISGLLQAQNLDRAAVTGQVQDETAGVLQSVSLTLRNDATGINFRTESGSSGDFTFPFVPPGTYSLVAERAGFSRLRMENITLSVNQQMRLPLTLKIGATATEVSVAAEANRVDATGAAIQTVISGEEVANLPILTTQKSRSVTDALAILVPGASSWAPGGRPYTNSISINGSPPRGIGFSFEGIDYSDHNSLAMGWLISQSLTPDAIGEFSVLTHTFKAEAGNRPVLINFTTKSGTNRFHGQVRALDLDPRLSTRDFFDEIKKSGSATRSLGMQLSGPIYVPKLYSGRDKSFFLVDLEKIYQSTGSTAIVNVLSDAQRLGDFSGLAPKLWPKDPLTGEDFPGGRIPEERILPQSRFFIDELIPKATRGNELVRLARVTSQTTQLALRIDHQLSSADSVNASVRFSPNHFAGPRININQAGFHSRQGTQNLALHHTRRFSAQAINAFTFGHSRAQTNSPWIGKHDDVELKQFGFNIQRLDSGYTGFPRVFLSSVGGFDPPGYVLLDETRVWTLKDAFTIQRRSHSFKLGWESRWVRPNQLIGEVAPPGFQFTSFNAFGSGNDVADFLLGIPHEYSQGTSYQGSPRRVVNSIFIQDDYKLRSNLMLNLGVRYEINGVATEKDGRIALFRPGVQSKVFPNFPPGLIFAGDQDPVSGRTIRGFNPPDHNNFAPRVGLAYSPNGTSEFWRRVSGGPGRSSVRLGYGVFYILDQHLLASLASFFPPWSVGTSRDALQLHTTGGTFANPWGTTPDPFLKTRDGWDVLRPASGGYLLGKSFPEPYQHQWTLSLQRELPNGFLAELAYVGNRGARLHRYFNGNPSPLTAAATVSNIFQRRQYHDFSGIAGLAADGSSSYNALQLQVSRRFGSRSQMNGNYVWSKTLGNADGTEWNQAGRDTSPWSRTNTDRRHSLVWHGFAELPAILPKTTFGRLISGWQASAIVQLSTGVPFDIRNAVDSTLQGFGREGCPTSWVPFNGSIPASGERSLYRMAILQRETSCLTLRCFAPFFQAGRRKRGSGIWAATSFQDRG